MNIQSHNVYTSDKHGKFLIYLLHIKRIYHKNYITSYAISGFEIFFHIGHLYYNILSQF